jgi:predicted amidohydrolase YtcJ
MKADLVVCADTVRTMADRSAHTAVAMSGGRIVALGQRHDVGRWQASGTEVVDLGGATLTPGLVDAHIHPVLGSLLTRGVDLSGATSLEHLRQLLCNATERGAEWVLGFALDPNMFAGRPIDRHAIDDMTRGRPAFLRLFDGHAALVSTEALRRAGIAGPRELASRSTVVCDAQGQPTGLLLEAEAIQLVEGLFPLLPIEETSDRVRATLNTMASQGLTGGHALEYAPETEAVMSALEEAGELPLRLRFAPWCMPGTAKEDWATTAALQGTGGRLWSVGGVKFFIDGTVDNGTAWLTAPDLYGESTDPFWRDPAAYVDALSFLHHAGVATMTHAIGDRGVEFALRALQAAGAGGDALPRHRIEHVETIPDETVALFAELGVTASMQPTHCTEFVEPDGSDNWSTRLGRERAAHGWRCRDLYDAGVPLVLGSDWPIAHSDPRAILAAAQLRRRAGEPAGTPVGPGQALSAEAAIAAYTRTTAWSVGDREGGTIEVGRRGDLTSFALDPMLASPDELAEAPIPMTVVAGRVVHRG